jgi:hypothetical protein
MASVDIDLVVDEQPDPGRYRTIRTVVYGKPDLVDEYVDRWLNRYGYAYFGRVECRSPGRAVLVRAESAD